MLEYSEDESKAKNALELYFRRLGVPKTAWEKIKNKFIKGFKQGWDEAIAEKSLIPNKLEGTGFIDLLFSDIIFRSEQVGYSIGSMAGTMREHHQYPLQSQNAQLRYIQFMETLRKRMPEFCNILKDIINPKIRKLNLIVEGYESVKKQSDFLNSLLRALG